VRFSVFMLSDYLTNKDVSPYGLRIFSTAVLTLNFDLDLSKANSETVLKIGLVVFEKSHSNDRTN